MADGGADVNRDLVALTKERSMALRHQQACRADHRLHIFQLPN